MTDTITERAVLEYALKTESDLKTALAVADAVPSLRRHILNAFLEELKCALVAKLRKGWSITPEIPDFIGETYAYFSFWKDEWRGKYDIGVEGQEHLRKGVVWGVGRDESKVKGEPNAEVLARFKNVFPDGKSNRVWEAYVKPRAPQFRYWNEAASLIQLQFHRDEAVKYFKMALLKARDITEPVLDKMSKA